MRSSISESDLLHPLIDELHEALAARSWQPSGETLDLANELARRGAVPPAARVGALTPHLRSRNGVTIKAVHAMAASAFEAAERRAGTIVGTGRARKTVAQPSAVTTAELFSIRVRIHDSAAPERLTEAGATASLEHHGWARSGEVRRSATGDRVLATAWTKGDASVVVPSDTVADRVLRMADLVVCLAEFEDRSELLVYRDLRRA